MIAPRVTLDGIPVVASVPVRWTFSAGIRPATTEVRLERVAAETLFAAAVAGAPTTAPTPTRPGLVAPGRASTLSIEIPGHDLLVLSRLYVMSLGPTDDPALVDVLLADGRVWWDRVHVARSYNVRRKTNDRRGFAPGAPRQAAAALTLQARDVDYARYSINPRNGKPWIAHDVLLDVLAAVAVDGISISGLAGRDVPVEGLQIDDPGPAAVGRALALVPGADLYLDERGVAVVFDRRDGAERLLAADTAPVVGRPLSALTDLRRSRPSEVHVLFTREVEWRVDTERVTGTAEDFAHMALNVLSVPDVSLVLPSGRTVLAGTWVPIDEALSAWEATPRLGQGVAINLDNLHDFYLIPAVFQALVQQSDPPDSVLAARISMLYAHFRRSYRIDRALMDRVVEVKDQRAALLDDETGLRAPAAVYSDWTAWYHQRGEAAANRHLRLADSFTGFAPLIADARLAPASVQVADGDLGILSISWLNDPTGRILTVVPGRVVGPDGVRVPLSDPREDRPGGAGILAAQLRLTRDYKATMIVTVVPAAPNDDRRFYRHVVTPADVEAITGLTVGPAVGPVWELRVGAATETARYEWRDDQEGAIGALVGFEPLDRAAAVAPVNLERLHFVAVAAAAELYARYMDRLEGTVAVGWTPELRPVGNAAAITHELATDGAALTTATLPSDVAPVDLVAFLPEDVRRQVLGLVKVGGPG